MSRRPWLGFGLSVAAHAVLLVVAVLAFSGDEWLPALVVDLRQDFFPGPASARAPSGGSGGEARAPAPPRRRSRPAGHDVAPVPPRVHEAPPESAPAPPPALIAAAPTPTPEPPPQLEPPRAAPAVPATRSLAGAVVADKPVSPSSDASESAARSEGAGRVTGSPPATGASASSGSGSERSATPASGEQPGAGVGGRSGETLVLGTGGGAGGGSGVGAEYGPYLTALRQRIQQSVRYPASARRRGISGTVSLEILILPTGVVADVQLLESSSHRVLDDAALDTVRSLPRLPLPPELPARSLRVRVPVVFQIQ